MLGGKRRANTWFHEGREESVYLRNSKEAKVAAASGQGKGDGSQ